MKNILLYLIIVGLNFSCKETPKNTTEINASKIEVNDSCCIINANYEKGDVRRYGIIPNEAINEKLLTKCIELANEGLPLYFPKGTYTTTLKLTGVSNIKINFDNAIVTGGLEIINQDSIPSENITINGKLTILDRLFIRKSKNISFDELHVLTDTINNLYHKKNRGVSIYAGSETIKFNKLIISDTGGNLDDFYKYSAAAFQVHGWNDNPRDITINEIQIINASRTAMYLTGYNHQISKTTIINFGFGKSDNMFGLEDVDDGLEKDFSGAWINKCNDCVLDSLSISNTTNYGKYSLNLGIGSYSNPTFINNISFKENAKLMPMKDNPLTNILVKNTY